MLGIARRLRAAGRQLLKPEPVAAPTTDPRLIYALNEVSELRKLVRLMLAESPTYRQRYASPTVESYEFVWDKMPTGRKMLNDPEFMEWGERLLLEHTGRPREWFKGKKILDAGSGEGRFSVLMARLGATVTAFDLSASGLADMAKHAAEFPISKAFIHNVLEPVPLDPDFDLVWHIGVAHHTGDTRRAVENVCQMVKPGGMVALMIYGEPRLDRLYDFEEINAYVDLRRTITHMTLQERVDYTRKRYGDHFAIGWFDAASPKINDLHRFDEVREWLIGWGFHSVELARDNRNLHIRAQTG